MEQSRDLSLEQTTQSRGPASGLWTNKHLETKSKPEGQEQGVIETKQRRAVAYPRTEASLVSCESTQEEGGREEEEGRGCCCLAFFLLPWHSISISLYQKKNSVCELRRGRSFICVEEKDDSSLKHHRYAADARETEAPRGAAMVMGFLGHLPIIRRATNWFVYYGSRPNLIFTAGAIVLVRYLGDETDHRRREGIHECWHALAFVRNLPW